MRRIIINLLIAVIFPYMGANQNLSAQVLEQDSLALVALYDSTDGANWEDNSNWLTETVSSWFGITVKDGRVTDINLSSNNLVGTIPSDLGNLTNLTFLNLGNNQISNTIPSEIGSLMNLEKLYLYGNQFKGTIPPEIGNLAKLTHLNLSFNQLTNTIPPELGNLKNVQVLTFSYNQLSDFFPPELGNLTNLKELYIQNNQFSGTIPIEINDLSNLKIFYLSNNQFHDLPNLSPITALTDLVIRNNKFTFEDIEPNINILNFFYSPQDSVGIKQDTSIEKGSTLELSVNVGGTANQYQWMKDGEVIPGANYSSYAIDAVESADEGSYICKISNTIATELTLYSRPINLTVSSEVGIIDHSISNTKVFALYQNYPNPFNSSTVIKYNLPKATKVVLRIYNLFGQEIKTLVNELQTSGRKKIIWNGLNEQGKKVTSGIYLYVIKTESFTKSNKMIIMK
ncbi:MAG: T9SS type A sorting domain-containing protein [bacterium]